ncbi:hypothetical protein [Chelativorans salis]|uniref:Uncharacterized protein n=1 Tax=Chelativorans salis TaxID=2978478 RepID=A0ABT2LJF7_9HYPH|nr:hypothetical protein [Chelativorans sp. EGI FJ00035]MCT7374726.1 hypothetical protein [Chelativorans sp. EGI FJ00035]
MQDRRDWKRQYFAPANDKVRPGVENAEDADIAPWQRIDKAVLSLARLIGRRMAREQHEALQKAQANDNAPPAGKAKEHVPEGGKKE